MYGEVFKMQDQKTRAISEIVKIIEECRYDDELAEGYKREILDQEEYMTRGAKEPPIGAGNSRRYLSRGDRIRTCDLVLPNH